MSIFTGSRHDEAGIRRDEILAAVAEVVAIFTIFIVAFTGRSYLSDAIKDVLVVLSLFAGAAGAVAGVWVLARGVQHAASRIPRLALGSFMTAIGIYTIVHVL